ncbi:MAG: hypothetical protein LBU77_06920 [Clostridiales bacterium]|jgi:hypothetical protein|nr:hypothetical protein [Clostridiales bacterium]
MMRTLKKLNDYMVMGYIKAMSKVDEIKEDENAMEVIQVVMIMAIGVIAVAAIWLGTNRLLEGWWGDITQKASTTPKEIKIN